VFVARRLRFEELPGGLSRSEQGDFPQRQFGSPALFEIRKPRAEFGRLVEEHGLQRNARRCQMSSLSVMETSNPPTSFAAQL